MTTTQSDKHNVVSFGEHRQPDRKLHAESPVFIVGIMERCGSNFLSDIVLIEPNFELPSILGEDYVLEHAHLLLEYADKTRDRWMQMKWIDDPQECRRWVLKQIGNGILDVLNQQIAGGKRLVTKTPAAFNVDKFFELFPTAKLLLLVRDGRDCVESAARTWPDVPYEHWMKQWADGARAILKFMQVAESLRGKSWELIRYEDLIARPKEVVTGILSVIGVDPQRYDWKQLESLPVHGSSQYRDEKGQVTGRMVQKSGDFKPLGRWQHWNWSRKRMFKKIAGDELVRLGYVSDTRW